MNLYEGPPFKFKHSNKVHSNFVNCVRFAPDGETFVSVGSDSKIFLYNGDSGEKTAEFTGGHSGTVYSASWSPDGAKLLTVRCATQGYLPGVTKCFPGLPRGFRVGASPQPFAASSLNAFGDSAPDSQKIPHCAHSLILLCPRIPIPLP